MSKVTQKHSVELMTSVVYAKNLDKKNGNSLWIDATSREMQNLKVAFDILEDGAKVPFGCNKAYGHLVFYVRVTLEWKD